MGMVVVTTKGRNGQMQEALAMGMKDVPMTGKVDWSHETRIIDDGRHL